MRPEWFVSESIDTAVAAKQLQQALQKLEPEYRELVVAHLWNGLTFRQIAEAFDISPSKAHRDYMSAIESLRSNITTNEIER
jgi:RNA polymerase sigma-70 factor (ECF subfamily)